jgi:hypothetical protein
MTSITLACPTCTVELRAIDNHYECPHCGRTYPCTLGIPSLGGNDIAPVVGPLLWPGELLRAPTREEAEAFIWATACTPCPMPLIAIWRAEYALDEGLQRTVKWNEQLLAI